MWGYRTRFKFYSIESIALATNLSLICNPNEKASSLSWHPWLLEGFILLTGWCFRSPNLQQALDSKKGWHRTTFLRWLLNSKANCRNSCPLSLLVLATTLCKIDCEVEDIKSTFKVLKLCDRETRDTVINCF